MSEKTSQKTEEEMLDQTFGNYDADTNLETQAPGDASATKTKKKSNTNMIIAAGVGIGAVVLLGAKFLMPSSQPAIDNPQNQVQAVDQQIAQAQPPVVETKPVEPVSAEPVNTDILPPANVLPTTEVPAEVPTATTTLPTAEVPTATTTLPTTEVPTATTTLPTKDVVGNKLNNVIKANGEQVDMVNQIQDMFDKQSEELKSSINAVDNRVVNVEKEILSQKDVNKSIENRLTALETGKQVVVSNVNQKGESLNTIKKPRKHKVKAVKTSAMPVKKLDANELLLDKSNEVKKDVLIDTEANIVNNLPKVEIHSVYSGRVWTKNTDGSLSTYVSGDRLPNGELIKKIDDEKYEIITDKRIINK